ncbi:MAG: hypothetical protein ACI30K_08635 [Muribaculaceae bacterium]
MIDHKSLSELDAKFGTPFYIMDGNKYRENIRSFLAAFHRRYKRVIAGYSFKTNYVPALCQIAKNEGCYAEVVSEMEFMLAKKLGFDNIIFNGPIKRPDILSEALDCGAIVNLDSEYEIYTVISYKQKHPHNDIKVGLRININLTDDKGNSTIQCGLRFGRFGFPDDILERNIHRLRQAGIKIISLHGHTSSSDRAVLNYKVITRHMLDTCQKYQLSDLQYFNIGGGYFGAAPNGMDLIGRPRYDDYANCVINEIENNSWFIKHKPFIVIEPGTSVVSNVFSYITKVYQNKHIGNANFVIVDGTVFDIKPTMHQYNLPHQVFRANNYRDSYVCDVVGSTCMEKDVLLKDISLPRLDTGDYILFDGVGAYTICLTPTFINFLAPILAKVDDEYIEIRRRQHLDDVISIYTIQ